MQKSYVFPVLAFSMSSLAAPAVADPVTVVGTSRSISVSASAGSSDTGTTSTFDQDVLSNTVGAVDPASGATATASALLSSFVSGATGTFGGHGITATTQNSTDAPAGAHAQASYFVALDLVTTLRYDFGAAFTATGGNETNRSAWHAQLFHFPIGPSPVTAFSFSGTGSDFLSASNTLGPGRYGFTVSSSSDSVSGGDGATGLDYTFSLAFSDPNGPAPVPEPASMLLLATGLAGIAGRRKLQTLRK